MRRVRGKDRPGGSWVCGRDMQMASKELGWTADYSGMGVSFCSALSKAELKRRAGVDAECV